MQITVGRLKEIVEEELQKSFLNENEKKKAPWENEYRNYNYVAMEVISKYSASRVSKNPVKTFSDFVKTLSSEQHAGAYHRLHAIGGFDPALKKHEPGDPEYIPWRERELKDSKLINIAILLRRLMDHKTHVMRRDMYAPPTDDRPPVGQQYSKDIEEESPIMRKYAGSQQSPSANVSKEDLMEMISKEITGDSKQMKITKAELMQMISEELGKVLEEEATSTVQPTPEEVAAGMSLSDRGKPQMSMSKDAVTVRTSGYPATDVHTQGGKAIGTEEHGTIPGSPGSAPGRKTTPLERLAGYGSKIKADGTDEIPEIGPHSREGGSVEGSGSPSDIAGARAAFPRGKTSAELAKEKKK